jgi:hypothetical protein
MQGIDADSDTSRLTLESSAPGNPTVQRAAQDASVVARALSSAGYETRHLSVTYSETGDLVLVARLDHHTPSSNRSSVMTRLAIGVILGVVLGFFGLPRLELAGSSAPRTADAVPTPVLVPQIVTADRPTPIVVPTPGPLVSVGPFNTPIRGWINDPTGTAWFASGVYHLYARDSGHFVATGVPLNQPLRGARLSAQFHKLGGPSGGGYGLIFRDQSATSERDGRNQSGAYLVAEVGDRGDIGVWQREQDRWIDIVPWTRSDAVHADRQPNALTVITSGFTVQVQVNGMLVADFNYDRLPPGGGVGIFTGGDLNEVALDWLRIDNMQ